MLSGTVTTLTVLLIIFFLFREGIGLFGKNPTEDGFSVAVNKANPVDELSPDQIKNIFDQNLIKWKEVGGTNDSIMLFRMDDLFNYYTEQELSGIDTNMNLLAAKIDEVISKNPGIIAFISSKEIPKSHHSKLIRIQPIGIGSFLGGKDGFLPRNLLLNLGFTRCLWVLYG